MAAKFVLKKGWTGKFRFNLVATNGQVIATSEAYESKASAIKGIESVKRNAPMTYEDHPEAARRGGRSNLSSRILISAREAVGSPTAVSPQPTKPG
jgi:uncharacterized protein YegP (UPF0339 family)